MTQIIDTTRAERGPNPLVRLVARFRASIRVKLLIAFLGITCLMTGLAISGLSALQQSNQRTEDLIRDQDRFSYYTELYGYLSDLQILALSAGIHPNVVNDWTEGSRQSSGVLVVDRIGDLEVFLGRGARRFGGQETPDGARLWRIRTVLQGLRPVAQRIRDERLARNMTTVQRISIDEFTPAAFRLQREIWTVMKDIEADMADHAKTTASAYSAARQQVMAVALVAVGLALLLGYAISSAMIWPVRRIGDTLHQVAGGAFNVRVAVPNRDELGELANNVNAMSARLGRLYDEVEAQKSQLSDWNAALEDKVATQVTEIERANRLRRFLPSQVADLLTGSNSAEEALATRRGEITVLFADLRGFTAFANQATPQEVVAALNSFHAACGPLIEAHGGTLERFLGDGVMVLFGAPLPVEDPAARAVALARDMQKDVRDTMADFRTGNTPLGLGIGIGSGAATLGQIGFEGRMDYSAIGPAPNLAARLCDMAGDGQILISHATAWQVDAEMKPAGPFDLKGIGPEVAAFELA